MRASAGEQCSLCSPCSPFYPTATVDLLKTTLHKKTKMCKNGIVFKKRHFNT